MTINNLQEFDFFMDKAENLSEKIDKLMKRLKREKDFHSRGLILAEIDELIAQRQLLVSEYRNSFKK